MYRKLGVPGSAGQAGRADRSLRLECLGRQNAMDCKSVLMEATGDDPHIIAPGPSERRVTE